jgi:hypothetical protein
MRWLVFALLVSLCVLLVAAAAVAGHIFRQHRLLVEKSQKEVADETNIEPGP